MPAGLLLIAFAVAFIDFTGGWASILPSVLVAFVNPFSIIPGLIGLGLLVYAPVSRARRMRIERVASGREDVDEPTAIHERDHGFFRSHLWSILGSVFFGLTMLLVGGLAAATYDPSTSITALAAAFTLVGLVTLIFPIKWWREWSAREELLNEREEWRLDSPARDSDEVGVAFDFGEDTQDEATHAAAEEVTRAR